jgi:branched-chain amino acid transport system ATP-binding protein
MLRLENIVVSYGNNTALKGVSLEVNKGEIITLLGANGAGKTTIMNTIMGLKECSSGKIYFEGKNITNQDTQVMVKNGIILCPEGRQVFPRFTVLDNLKMGSYLRSKSEVEESLSIVYKLFPVLKERENQIAGTLSGGEQQMLAVGRAVMGKPRLLMLDEPSLGLAPLVVKEIFNMILRIRDMGNTILLVEQNAKVALKISDRAYVLETGKIVLHDRAENLLNSDEVRGAYLGGL